MYIQQAVAQHDENYIKWAFEQGMSRTNAVNLRNIFLRNLQQHELTQHQADDLFTFLGML